MAKYIVDDLDYKILDTHQKASFNEFLLDYKIDENTEIAKGKDTLQYIWGIVFNKQKVNINIFKIKSIHEFYTFICTILITLDAIAIIDLAGVLCYYFITYYLFGKNPIRWIFVIIILKMFIFIIGMIILIILFTRLKDNVQKNIEKILMKL